MCRTPTRHLKKQRLQSVRFLKLDLKDSGGPKGFQASFSAFSEGTIYAKSCIR